MSKPAATATAEIKLNRARQGIFSSLPSFCFLMLAGPHDFTAFYALFKYNIARASRELFCLCRSQLAKTDTARRHPIVSFSEISRQPVRRETVIKGRGVVGRMSSKFIRCDPSRRMFEMMSR